jgi:preprotein translocase subunit YajC
MNLYKINTKNKNINLYSRFYILLIRNQRKKTKKLISE